ncbi:MAG TPA: hypothetical protein VLR93_07885 [Patescibacteria group bacterium]|nr:hypothetical protein [Patescibacteria group bacterium]
MAINVLRGLRNRVAAPTVDSGDMSDDMPPAVETGETQRGPRFACPTCGRPLSLTEITCPSCGLKVLAGVPLRHGAALMVAGVALGLVVGIGLAVVLAFTGQPAKTAVDVPVASGAPVDGNGGSFDPGLVSGPVPATAATALRLSVTIEDRLAASAASLRKQVKAKSFNSVAAATTIRAIAADAAWGSDNIDRLSGWPAAAPVRAQLDGFYEDLRKTARDALGVSIKDTAKYKAFSKRIIKILASIPTTRTAIEQLAAANQISIPKAPAPAP